MCVSVCASMCTIKIAYVFSITYLLHINVGTNQVSVCILTYFCFVHSTIFFLFLLLLLVLLPLSLSLSLLLLFWFKFYCVCCCCCFFRCVDLIPYCSTSDLYIYFLALFKYIKIECECVHAWCVCVNCLVDVTRRSLSQFIVTFK